MIKKKWRKTDTCVFCWMTLKLVVFILCCYRIHFEI